MTLWQERGGVPLLTVVALMVSTCIGAAITVATREEAQPDTVPAPQTIELGDLAAELASALADELDLTPAQQHRVVRVITATGEGIEVAVPDPSPASPTVTSSPPVTTTTTTTMPPPTTTTSPRVPTVADLLDVLIAQDPTPPTPAP